MLSEVEMENPGGEVLPGAYVVVRLRVGLATRGMTIPANALLFRSEGLRVAVVRDGRARASERAGEDGPIVDRAVAQPRMNAARSGLGIERSM